MTNDDPTDKQCPFVDAPCDECKSSAWLHRVTDFDNPDGAFLCGACRESRARAALAAEVTQ